MKHEKNNNCWENILELEMSKQNYKNINYFIENESKLGKVIYPHTNNILSAFRLTEFSKVKVVILGQDPYHGKGQANGLAFSVNDNIKIPPSLANIYREISNDIGYFKTNSGNLISWAKQGVFLLNTVLTVEENKPGSHRNKGWEIFTDNIIRYLNKAPQHIVFLLWGKFAQQKVSIIDKRHTILLASHPSPLSAYRGFLGCKHFSKANKALLRNEQTPINWCEF